MHASIATWDHVSTSDLSINRWDQLNTTASNSTEWTVLYRCVYIYIYNSDYYAGLKQNFVILFTMLTELTRVDLSSEPDYSYEEMGPLSSSSPLSSDSAFGDQLTCSVELVSLQYQYNGGWALGWRLGRRSEGKMR